MSGSLTPDYIDSLVAYSSAKSEKQTGSTWLNANESPYTKNWQIDSDTLNRYPDPQPQNVIDAYASYARVASEQVLMTRGADEGIELLMRTFCYSSKDAISQFLPTYGMYKVSANTHNVAINNLSQTLLQQGSAEDIVDASADAKLVFICNPNNPTGAMISVQKIAQICQGLCDKAIVVVDEAYIEFCPEQSAVSLINEFDNVVVLRTLSKAFALAGLRCGFLMTSAKLMAPLRKVIAPYPVSSVVASIAEQALASDSITSMRRQVSILNRLKGTLNEWLTQSPAITQVLQGEGNFITCQLVSTDFIAIAKQRGLIMRPFTLFEQNNWLRISIGNEQELNEVKLWLQQCEAAMQSVVNKEQK